MEKKLKPAQQHGDPIEKRSFFRMFDIPGVLFKPEALSDLADAQNLIKVNDGNVLPAGFTYLGQFVDHDITKLKRSDKRPSTGSIPVDELIQERTPSLDLDCLYGKGLFNDHVHYDEDGNFVSENFVQNNGIKKILDLPRRRGSRCKLACILPRRRSIDGKLARIADSRNDENFIISRMHVLFMNAHNALLRQHQIDFGKHSENFSNVRKELSLIYQLIIKQDFLTRILHPNTIGLLDEQPTLKNVLAPESEINVNPLIDVTAVMQSQVPIEFAGAAYRFGHALVQPTYELSLERRQFDLKELFKFVGRGGLGGRNSNSDIDLDWEVFFDIYGPDTAQKANAITTQLTALMSMLPNESKGNANLTLRNLLRGSEIGLPDAQSCIQYILESQSNYEVTGLSVLKGKKLVKRTFLDRDSHADEEQKKLAQRVIDWGLDKQTPLWTYILMEPALRADPKLRDKQLGLLGSMIVASVFRSLFITSRTALYNCRSYPDECAWLETGNMEFTMDKLIKLVNK